MKNIIALDGVESCLKERVGAKAFNLAVLKSRELNLPDAVAIDCEVFRKHLEKSIGEEGIRKLEACLLNRLDLAYYFGIIRDSIMKTPMDSEVESAIVNCVEENIKGAEVFAVRSSAMAEDLFDSSKAGIYESFMPVSKAEIGIFVKKCWCSAFSDRVLVGFHNKEIKIDNLMIAVIIQRYVKADYSGIMFSKDPLNINNQNVIIEYTRGMGENIATNGDACERLVVKEDVIPNSVNLDKNILTELIGHAKRIEQISNYPQDIEWCLKDGTLFILQSRNITTGSSEENRDKFIFCDVCNIPDKFEFGDAYIFHEKYMRKKRFLKEYCYDNGVETTRWSWLRYNEKSLLDEENQKFIEYFRTPYVMVDVNRNMQGVNLPVEVLITWLLELATEEYRSVMIRESVPTEQAVMSSVLENGNVFLEVAKGAMKGIMSGAVNTSKYNMNEKGVVMDKVLEYQEKYYKMNEVDFTIDLIQNEDNRRTELEDQFLTTIAATTYKMKEVFDNSCFEWWIWNGTCFFVDMSKSNFFKWESDSIVASELPSCGISGFIVDAKELPLVNCEYLSHGFSMSVTETEDDFDQIQEIKKTKNYLQEMKNKYGKIVLKAETPYLIYSSFFDYIDALIFEKGSVLCHLCILCRERSIPAVICAEAFYELDMGTEVLIENTKIHVLGNLDEKTSSN